MLHSANLRIDDIYQFEKRFCMIKRSVKNCVHKFAIVSWVSCLSFQLSRGDRDLVVKGGLRLAVPLLRALPGMVMA